MLMHGGIITLSPMYDEDESFMARDSLVPERLVVPSGHSPDDSFHMHSTRRALARKAGRDYWQGIPGCENLSLPDTAWLQQPGSARYPIPGLPTILRTAFLVHARRASYMSHIPNRRKRVYGGARLTFAHDSMGLGVFASQRIE